MIKQATLEQLEDVVPLFDAYRVFYKQESDVERARNFLRERMENHESIVFLAYKEHKAVGFTQLYPKYSSARTTRNWILNDLYVDKDFRKKGIGRQLIEQAFSFAKDKGAVFVQLSTQVDNLTAQSLYKEIGFQLQEPDVEFLEFRKSI